MKRNGGESTRDAALQRGHESRDGYASHVVGCDRATQPPPDIAFTAGPAHRLEHEAAGHECVGASIRMKRSDIYSGRDGSRASSPLEMGH